MAAYPVFVYVVSRAGRQVDWLASPLASPHEKQRTQLYRPLSGSSRSQTEIYSVCISDVNICVSLAACSASCVLLYSGVIFLHKHQSSACTWQCLCMLNSVQTTLQEGWSFFISLTTLQYIAIYRNILQYTAIYCNKQQYTAI